MERNSPETSLNFHESAENPKPADEAPIAAPAWSFSTFDESNSGEDLFQANLIDSNEIDLNHDQIQPLEMTPNSIESDEIQPVVMISNANLSQTMLRS